MTFNLELKPQGFCVTVLCLGCDEFCVINFICCVWLMFRIFTTEGPTEMDSIPFQWHLLLSTYQLPVWWFKLYVYYHLVFSSSFLQTQLLHVIIYFYLFLKHLSVVFLCIFRRMKKMASVQILSRLLQGHRHNRSHWRKAGRENLFRQIHRRLKSLKKNQWRDQQRRTQNQNCQG